MKKLFYGGLTLLVLFEAANVYFIMPFPGSQRSNSIDLAYFLYSWRWFFRAALGAMIVVGAPSAFPSRGWRLAVASTSVCVAAVVTYALNFKMVADKIFLAPTTVRMEPAARNAVDARRLVVGLEINGDARAYPLQFIGYHHQVRDSAGGQPVLVTYCTVCRTGRVFSPVVDGRPESFRLVGMDHFNAMFEDRTTHSWWRQANGEAVAGPRKGARLAELTSMQVTLAQWLALHPDSRVLQPDSTMLSRYPTSYAYETGESRSALTGTDTASWHDKSWVVGLTVGRESKAYDWNRLRKERIVNDVVGRTPVAIVVASDTASYVAFQRPDSAALRLVGDSLVAGKRKFGLNGRGPAGNLKMLFASQEFWHSWRTFHPNTTKY